MLVLIITILSLFVSWYFFKKNVTGFYLSGMIVGAFLEWCTEIYWDYSLNVYIYKDISMFVVLGWGYHLTFIVLVSNYLFKHVAKKFVSKSYLILLCDILIGTVWFVLNEMIGMKILHLWNYSEIVEWKHLIPGTSYPIEALIGAILLALVSPTFVRKWGYLLRYR